MADQRSNRTPSQNPTEQARSGVVGALTTKDFSQTVAKFEEQFSRLIPNSLRRSDILTGKRVVGLVINAFMQNEDLQRCRPSTILNAAGLACAVGLEFNNSLGQSAIIPYKDMASWQPMYRGLITLALRADKVESVTAQVVMEDDYFEYQYGTGAFLNHKPADRWNREFKLDDAWRKAYSFVKFKGGGENFHVMDRQQIEAIKAQASTASSSKAPWNVEAYREEMIRKTPVKQHHKYLDLTPHLSMAVGLDDQAEVGAKQDVVLDWKDYSAEDLDHKKKTQVRGADFPPPAKPNGDGQGSEPPPPPAGLWPEEIAAADNGPYREEDFSAEEFERLLGAFKGTGQGQTKAQFLAFLSKFRGSKRALVEHLMLPD